MSSAKATLFLGDLSTFCTELEIHNLFSQYGEIVEIKIMRSEETFRNLSYGFIKFVHPLSAKRAMNALNGVLFCGRNLRVGWASYKSKKEPKLLHHDRIESSSVHISFISYQLKDLITEESLRQLFSTYGVVIDTSIKKCYIDQSINRQCGYGFVHYASSQEGIESALAAVAGLNDATIDNVCYKCSISHNLEKYLLDTQNGSRTSSPYDSSPYRQDNSPTCSDSEYGGYPRGHMELKESDLLRLSFRRDRMNPQHQHPLHFDRNSRPHSRTNSGSEFSFGPSDTYETETFFDESLNRTYRNQHATNPPMNMQQKYFPPQRLSANNNNSNYSSNGSPVYGRSMKSSNPLPNLSLLSPLEQNDSLTIQLPTLSPQDTLVSPVNVGLPTRTFYDNLLKLSTDERDKNNQGLYNNFVQNAPTYSLFESSRLNKYEQQQFGSNQDLFLPFTAANRNVGENQSRVELF